MSEFVDTHCHIQFNEYKLDPDKVITEAASKGVTRLICVGCAPEDSQLGVELAAKHKNVWASVGIHPHEAQKYINDKKSLSKLRSLAKQPKVVAIGEIGLDYYYKHSPKKDQIKLLRYQLKIANELDLPVIFHVREAFDDFFEVLSDFKHTRGVIHSFTADTAVLYKCIEKGLYIGLNGIMTFTKDNDQLTAAKEVPSNRLVLETDAPFLTPVPFRGTICQPMHVVSTAQFLAELRDETVEDLAKKTTNNAKRLFKL